ncbi:MAG TPA: SPFH/Band 7/PHB domain protein, partial [Chloroflexi bacterium]|nr:SPFH/Band 7/PHB domain protein [Chloroflexota bacterium]
METLIILAIFILFGLIILSMTVRIVPEYRRLVVFR